MNKIKKILFGAVLMGLSFSNSVFAVLANDSSGAERGLEKLGNLTSAVGNLFSDGMLDLVIGGGILGVVVAIMVVVVYVAEKGAGKKK